MPADPPTLFLVLLVLTSVGALLLWWCWWQNRADRTLLWVGIAYASAAVGAILFAGRGVIPDELSIDLAVAIMLYAVGQSWVAARVFNGRSVHYWVSLIGPLIWILACRIPGFHESYEARVILAAVIMASYGIIAAKEFWVRDGLPSRYPLAIALILHSIIVSARIPLAIIDIGRAPGPFKSVWFGPAVLEAFVFLQVVAFLIISLTKERVEAQLRSAALTDPLTGLSNRRAVFEQGSAILANAARHGRPTSVVIFDLDRFKEINDTYGHPVGDAVIRAFAAATKGALRASDHAGRIGGEEFVVLLPDTTEAQADLVARRIMASFVNLAARVEGCRMRCTASAGIAASSTSAHSLEALLASADSALYEAKREGRGPMAVAAAS